MAFAKLSGALLGSRVVPAVVAPAEPLPQPTGAPPPPSAEDAKQLAQYLSALRLPGFAREYHQLAKQCAAEGLDHSRFLLRLAELELSERERRRVERRIREAHFPATKSLEGFDFSALTFLDRRTVLELAQCDFVARRENVIAIGNSGTGKTHIAVALGLAACRKGFSVGFTTAATLVQELLETRAERRVLILQRRLETYRLLIIDELGYVPLPPAGAELLFEVLSRRCERSSTLITSSLPPHEWVQVFGRDRLAGAALDRLSHNIH